jgi:TolB-like protein/Flp pilus assembly protein TadD
MKRCPECRRDYIDDSLMYCLEDGTALVQGSVPSPDEPQTAILHDTSAPGEPATKAQIHTTNIPPQGETQTKFGGGSMKILVIAAAAIILLVGGFYGFRYFRADAKQINSIAVMPFVNESGDADAEYLSDGMTETLIGSLSKLPNMNVKARSTVFNYKGKVTDPKTIGKELSVQAVLNGRVLQRGDELTLSLELVNTDTDNVIWSERYNRKQSDLVSLQGDIARDVVDELRWKLTGDEQKKLTKGNTQDTEAYQLYLKGRYYWNKRTDEGTTKAMDYFQQATDKDPNYALAYVGVADSYIVSNFPHGTEDRAKAAAMKALEIDDTLGEAHATLGTIEEWEWYAYTGADAEREFKRAIELNPNYPTAHHWYGEFLTTRGRFDEAFTEYQRALELDPLSLAISTDLGNAYYNARQYDRAIDHLKKLIEIDPTYVRTHFYLAQVYQDKGMFDEAVAENEKGRVLNGIDPKLAAKRRVLLEEALRVSGPKGYWRKWLDIGSDDGQVHPNETAGVYARLGDKDQALAWLEKAYDAHLHMEWLKVDPQWDNLRSDPRFQDLLRRVGLAQ